MGQDRDDQPGTATAATPPTGALLDHFRPKQILVVGNLWYEVKLERSLRDTQIERDRVAAAREKAEQMRAEAERQRNDAERNLYLAQLPMAQRAWDNSRFDPNYVIEI